MAKSVKIKFGNRFAFLGFTCLVTQQIISASSNYWLVHLQKAVRHQRPFSLILGCLFLSFILPYLPAAAAAVARTRWSREVVMTYTHMFVERNRANWVLYGDKKAKERALQILSNEGIRTLEETTHYYHQLATALLNIACNILALSLLIDSRFAIAHLTSVTLGYAIIRRQNPQQVALFKKAQDKRIDVGQLLLTSSDNVLIGNTYNFSQWWRTFSRGMKQSMQSQIVAVRFREGVSVLSSVATYAPCLLLAFWLGVRESHRPDDLSNLIALLPRLSLVLSYTYYLTFLLAQWQSFKARVQVIDEILTPPRKSPRDVLERRIHWPGIYQSVDGQELMPVHSLQHLVELIQKQPGRITLRGENGTGKSTLLLLVKAHLKEKAFYLPTHHQLQFRTRLRARSTGQRLIAQMEELQQHLPAQIYLLDEWDANLDAKNVQRISRIIDQLAENRCVVEVRHRHP